MPKLIISANMQISPLSDYSDLKFRQTENCRTGLLRVVPHVVQYLLDEGTWLFGEDRGHLILEANHMGTLLALMVLDGTEVDHIHSTKFPFFIATPK